MADEKKDAKTEVANETKDPVDPFPMGVPLSETAGTRRQALAALEDFTRDVTKHLDNLERNVRVAGVEKGETAPHPAIDGMREGAKLFRDALNSSLFPADEGA